MRIKGDTRLSVLNTVPGIDYFSEKQKGGHCVKMSLAKKEWLQDEVGRSSPIGPHR